MTAHADYEAAYRRAFPRLVAIAASMTGRTDLAHDLAQETLIRAYDRWTQVSDYQSTFGWMRRVITNLVIDQHRRDRAKHVAVERLIDRHAMVSPPPELDAWNDLVAPLTSKQRVIATLYYAEDLSVDDIASVVDVSPGTVKATLSQVRTKLRQHLEISNDKEPHHGST